MEDLTVSAVGKDFRILRELIDKKTADLCIYGCGVNGEVMYDFLSQQGVMIDFFVDRQAERREFEILGTKVISPDRYLKEYRNKKIIISPDHHEEIVNMLKKQGIANDHMIIPFRKTVKNIRVLKDNYTPKLPENSHAKKRGDRSSKQEVTIFTILYNTPAWMLCRTIESVLNQSYRDLRYLVIDNGSTDGSADLIKTYAKLDERICYIRLKKNVVWTDRKLLTLLKEHITTEYVAMLDSDDYYEETFVEKTLNLMKDHQAQMVQVNTLTYAHEGFRYNFYTHYWGETLCVEDKEKEQMLLRRILFVPVWGKLFMTKLFADLIDQMLSYEPDEERDRNFCLDISWITYMALHCSRVVLSDEILHIRTWRPGSSEHADNHSSKWLSSILWSFQYLRKNGITYEESRIFEEAQLVWLFNLQRENVRLSVFREKDLENERVKAFLKRPMCDRYSEEQEV